MKELRWDGVAERLSRAARIELLYILLQAGLRRGDVAKLCGVGVSAVSNWISSPIHHPSNSAADALLKAAWERDPQTVAGILKAEARRFASELRNIGIKDFTGV